MGECIRCSSLPNIRRNSALGKERRECGDFPSNSKIKFFLLTLPAGWQLLPVLSQMLTELLGLTTPCPGPASLSLLRRFSGKLSMESASVVSRVLPLPLNFKFSFQFRKFFCCDLKFKCKFFLLRIAVEERVSETSLLWISF